VHQIQNKTAEPIERRFNVKNHDSQKKLNAVNYISCYVSIKTTLLIHWTILQIPVSQPLIHV